MTQSISLTLTSILWLSIFPPIHSTPIKINETHQLKEFTFGVKKNFFFLLKASFILIFYFFLFVEKKNIRN